MKIEINNTLIKKIGELADREGFNAFLVGGYVRDLLLGKKGIDIDIMVTGDGIGFAETVAKEFGTKLDAVYKNFETALLNLDEIKLEFASSRKESYKKNSRKPDVRPGTLKEDLSRRDFTINALAVSINKETFGEVFDEFDGLGEYE